MVTQRKSRCDMHVPIPCVINDPRSHPHQPQVNPFDGPARIFISHVETADQVQQIIGHKTHLQPGFLRREPMAACLVPTQRILALLYPVFDITLPVVNLDRRKCRQLGIGHDKITAGKQFTHMPIYLCNHPAGAVPAFCLIGHIYVFDLDAAFRRAAHRPVQMRFNQLCQHRIAAQTNEIGNPFSSQKS